MKCMCVGYVAGLQVIKGNSSPTFGIDTSKCTLHHQAPERSERKT